MKKTYDYFDHEADTGIIGRGKTVTDAFESGAQAVFAIMTDLALVKPEQSIAIEFDEPNLEFAFVTWLNHLITASYIENSIYSKFELEQSNGHWTGKAYGEPWREDFIPGIEVKGATLTMLSVKQINKHWEARCVVDV